MSEAVTDEAAAAKPTLQPLEATRAELETLSVERLDKLIAIRKGYAMDPQYQDELGQLNVELGWLFDARTAVAVRESKAAASGPGKVIVEGVEYLMPEKLTMGEAADIEQLVGGDTAGAAVRLMLGMTWVALRRRDSGWTLERVRGIDFESVQVVEGDAGPPAEAA